LLTESVSLKSATYAFLCDILATNTDTPVPMLPCIANINQQGSGNVKKN
jgi:hypothetical protein